MFRSSSNFRSRESAASGFCYDNGQAYPRSYTKMVRVIMKMMRKMVRVIMKMVRVIMKMMRKIVLLIMQMNDHASHQQDRLH